MKAEDIVDNTCMSPVYCGEHIKVELPASKMQSASHQHSGATNYSMLWLSYSVVSLRSTMSDNKNNVHNYIVCTV